LLAVTADGLTIWEHIGDWLIPRVVPLPAGGWNLGAAGDFDGDGKADPAFYSDFDPMPDPKEEWRVLVLLTNSK
jgi:hypothetical protein